MEKDYILKVWNTLTECYEEVMVTKELYDEYNRSHWKIKRNDKRFFEHEIQFSTLEDEDNESGDGNYEIADLEQAPETLLMKALQNEELKQALAQLSQEEVELFETLIHDNVNEEDYGVKIGISQQGVSKKKQKIIKKLKKFLKSGCENG